ncbi:MAG: HK97 family phage prohead protease [Rhodospirillales bacterium]|nr:HK97 family phage prohead protease [Rhodospirillales bacterium]MDE0382018.1 HK97 family phage prohead protease [Rhodospirillales bacterium]
MAERRHVGEVRAEGRRLSGTVMAYGDVSPSHRERFEPRSLRLAEAVHLDLHHDALRAVAWHPGGGLELRQDDKALRMIAELPPIPAADAALDQVRSGRTTGLSVEFRATKERREGGLRVIEAAVLSGIGIVRSPSYHQSQVEARRRSGRTMRATIPADAEVECRCSGVECKFARVTGEAMQDAFDQAFRQFEREVIAGFGGYDMPLASASAGTLRGRINGDGDGEVEIDLPDDTNGAATVAAHDAAGVIVRPHIDSQDAESTIEGETRIYTRAPIRAFLVSATDARRGWPAPQLVATPEELAAATAPRRRRRVWL